MMNSKETGDLWSTVLKSVQVSCLIFQFFFFLFFQKTFHFSDMIMGFLFEGCNINSWLGMLAAIGAVFLVAVVLELIKLLNSKLKQNRCKSPLEATHDPGTKRKGSINGQPSTQHSPLLASLRIPSSTSKIRQRRLKFHMVESVLHIFKVSFGYILMLVVMTYNAYLLITIVLALSAGYFFLAPMRRMRDPRRVPVRHESLSNSERRSFVGSTSSVTTVESADNVHSHPHYGSLYQ